MNCKICNINPIGFKNKKDKKTSLKIYDLKVCGDCFFKQFPELIGKNLTMWNINKYTKFAYQIPDDEYFILSKKYNGRTLNNFIEKYGEELGKEKWKSYCDKQAYAGNNEKYFIEKLGEEAGKEKYKQVNSSRAISLENLIKKYGEDEGKKRWKSYCNKQAYAGCKIEYFIEKYGEDEGTIKYKDLNKSKAISLENLIKKYGEDEGKKRWKDFCEKGRLSPGTISKASQKFLNKLENKLKDLDLNTFFYDKNKEKRIQYNEIYYSVDYFIEDFNFIVEFNGDYWHANPMHYLENDILTFPNKLVLSAKEIWERDRIRINNLKSLGYNIFVVWESAANDEIIDSIYNLIKSKI